VLRDLTLRSASSFGAFHLIRLLFDEYLFYSVEHKVAAATGVSVIAAFGNIKQVGMLETWRYGDSVDNTVEDSSVFSLVQMHWLPSARAYGQ